MPWLWFVQVMDTQVTMKTINIYYDGPIDPKLDALIRKTMEKAGFNWYAQSHSVEDDRRDLAFDSPGELVGRLVDRIPG